MLADQLDYVVGVDSHRDSHALAVMHVVSGAVLFEATVDASSDGYAHALRLVDKHAAGRRVFAVEGTGSFGAGLTRFLCTRGERKIGTGRSCVELVDDLELGPVEILVALQQHEPGHGKDERLKRARPGRVANEQPVVGQTMRWSVYASATPVV